jgi:hypothetical protein
MSTHDDNGPGLTDTDINSERPDGSGGEGTSATTSGASDGSPADASGAATDEDVERGNADGSTASAAPREGTLDDAQDVAQDVAGTGAQEWADQASAEGESGQDNGRAQ